MELKNQLCTIEQGKRFEELEVKAESYFLWIVYVSHAYNAAKTSKPNLSPHVDLISFKEIDDYDREYIDIMGIYPAYSAAELGVMLPERIKIRHSKYIKGFEYEYKEWSAFYVYYSDFSNECERKFLFDSKHEAHAKADLLIHLLEQKLIKPENLELSETGRGAKGFGSTDQ